MLEEIRAFFIHLNFNPFLMKNIIAVFILLIVVGCDDTKEKTIQDLLVQNNKYYSVQLEEYKLELEQQREDDPAHFDEEYYQTIDSSFAAINKLKSIANYDHTFETIKGLGYELKIDEKIKAIQSDDLEVLKNNLYVNLLNVVHRKRVIASLRQSTHCVLGSNYFKIVKKNENDSVSLSIYTHNNFQVNIDEISDGDEYLQYLSNPQNMVWSIKYKPKSKNTHCTGRIFFNDPYYGRILMIQEFDDKNALSENPF